MSNYTSSTSNIDGDLLAAGSALAKQRQKLGLGTDECAESLKITQGKLLALEAGKRSAFTSELFIRGYIKNYAKLVNISESEILHIYNAQTDVGGEWELVKSQKKTRSWWWLPYVVGTLTLAGWFFVYEYFSSDKTEFFLSAGDAVVESVSTKEVVDTANIETTNDDSLTVDTEVETEVLELDTQGLTEHIVEGVKQVSDESTLLTENSVDSSIEASSNILESESVAEEDVSSLVNNVAAVELLDNPVSVEGSVNNEGSAIVGVIARLSFFFREDCWLEVIDSSGEIVISDLYFKGRNLQVEGSAPFTITFGNVKGASLSLNDEPVVLGEGNSNGTFRITVGG